MGLRHNQVLDASASLAPVSLRVRLAAMRQGMALAGLRDYPDRSQAALRSAIARLHGIDPDWILPGNGAAELFTWAARDAAAAGQSAVPAPGFGDYSRALRNWQGDAVPWVLPLDHFAAAAQPLPAPPSAAVLWITNPHNPTGQLWTRASLQPLLAAHRLVICDEAFLPLVSGGEEHSLIPLLAEHPNLVVIRSLTKLYGLAGLRLGYALAVPERLRRWGEGRDPWPVNGLAVDLGLQLLRTPGRYHRHCAWVQRWSMREGAWLRRGLAALAGSAGVLEALPSAANFFLLRASGSLLPLREALLRRHAIVLRDCRSFAGLDARWLRIGVQSQRDNRRLLRAMTQEISLMSP